MATFVESPNIVLKLTNFMNQMKVILDYMFKDLLCDRCRSGSANASVSEGGTLFLSWYWYCLLLLAAGALLLLAASTLLLI